MTNSSRESYSPTLATDADVTTMWQSIINPLGWHNARMYVVAIDRDRRLTPVVTEIDEVPARFTADNAGALMETYVQVLDEFVPGGSLAILVCRPGCPQVTDDDRRWCRNLYDAGRDADIPLELLHLGTDTEIVPVPMDEVLPRTA
jgi:hypothetical protein